MASLNFDLVWVECSDGIYRSNRSDVELEKEEIDSDEEKGWLRRIN